MQIIIIGGFLGSGKTTTLLNLGKTLTEQGRKIAIIVNEIGEVGLDGTTLATSGIQTREITDGCICCTLKISMEYTLQSLKEEYEPDTIIMEPTGLAFPKQIKDDLEIMDLEGVTFAPLVNIIDGTRFSAEIRQAPKFIQTQIEDAEILVINKIDIAPEEKVEAVFNALQEINPEATILKTSATEENQNFQQLIDILAHSSTRARKDTDRNSIEESGVAAYSIKYQLEEGTINEEIAENIAIGVLTNLKEAILELNPEFVGHMKIAVNTGSKLIRASITSAEAEIGIQVLENQARTSPFLALLCAVTNIDKEKLKSFMKDFTEKSLKRHGAHFKKEGESCEHHHTIKIDDLIA
ncbi:G3E family GTPase [Methanohalophilus levihalophilus]|uniref:GTP-binding protein n=1 Tax=Methanohalophilus levihalophilus TaxID=1431282 RepID=UPI001AE2EC55|nr:GTP-binding protein [Methanohalophilus levihalophilus]MBP2029092.1 G3E family GTPase [Methanohalophilus levihalophilus]